MNRQMFLNVAVKDLKNSVAFYRSLGFEFNMHFTNDDGACMIVADNIFVMLLTETFFKTFTPTTTLIDAKKNTEVLICINAESKEKVKELVGKAVSLGGNTYRAPQDMGFMYSEAFQDLDGHIWEIMWMDPKAIPA
jgi:predicted lactoylglutathione lyase